MSIMVMDVEGTDGRERGEDQVSSFLWLIIRRNRHAGRILNENQLFSLLLRPKSLSSTCGSIKSVSTREPTWAC